MHGALDARARLEEAAMAGKGRASVNDMKRVEVLVLMEIAQQSESGGTYGFSRKTLAEHVGCLRIEPAPQLSAWILTV